MNHKRIPTVAFHVIHLAPINIAKLLVGVFAVFGISLPYARARPTLEVMFSFQQEGPAWPTSSLIQATDGNFYGTTRGGIGEGMGTVFKMTPAGVLTRLVQFTGNGVSNKGASPQASLVQATDGNLYGTTYTGGASDLGTIFKMTTAGVVTTLVEFEGNSATNQGVNPSAALVEGSDGAFYGTTSGRSGYGLGTVFKITPAGVLTTLVQFSGNGASNKGSFPLAGLIKGDDGNFYGTTASGGASGNGTVFKMTPAGVLTTLVEFTGNGATNKGDSPRAGLVQGTDGNFYGTTHQGGAGDWGTVFKVTPVGGLTTLVEFTFNGATNKGAYPTSALVQGTDGNFYGTTSYSASNHGTAFKVTPGGTLTTLVEFTGNSATNKGSRPGAGLLKGSDGEFYGTTEFGGGSGDGNALRDGRGTVFKMTSTGALTTLVDFSSNTVKGQSPRSALVQHSDGNLYGTTQLGGASLSGTVFKITPFGVMDTLVNFTGTFGAFQGFAPNALVKGGDGSFYGTTAYGGSHADTRFSPPIITYATGTIFKMTPSGAYTELFLFGAGSGHAESGKNPFSGLLQGTDGNLYGTTSAGGANGFGKIFRTTTAGEITTLVDFTGTDGLAKGSDPQGELLLASGGNFYGTTNTGGASDLGTVFRMTPTGALTTLVEFTGDGAANKGANPKAALIQGTNGKFYGTTTAGGEAGFGTIFRMSTKGMLATLVQFTGNGATNKGASPQGALLEGADGNFYGTTLKGGTYDAGTLFMMTPFGTLTTLVHFRPFPSGRGAYPYAGLVKGLDNNFYGTTEQGGTGGGGTVYRLRFGPTPETKVATAVASTTATLAGRVNPRGLATTVSFQIGTKKSFAGTTPMIVTTLPAGTSFKSLSLPVSGLAPNTKYYFRVVAENGDNSVPQTGKTYSFTTLP